MTSRPPRGGRGLKLVFFWFFSALFKVALLAEGVD